MTVFSSRLAAIYGVLAAETFDLHKHDNLAPAPSPDSFLLQGWTVDGYLAASSILLGIADTIRPEYLRYYGVVLVPKAANSPVLVIIRGTATGEEWADDGNIFPYTFPSKVNSGKVASGFFSIYRTLSFTVQGEQIKPEVPASESLMARYPDRPIRVIGHSLGAAMATYLSYDLCTHGHRDAVSACLFASPHPGDKAFCSAYGSTRIQYDNYVYERDLVPRLPANLEPLGSVTTLKVLDDSIHGVRDSARIKVDLLANHHVLDYAAMIDPTIMAPAQWARALKEDDCATDCIVYLLINGEKLAVSYVEGTLPPKLPAMA